MKAVVCGEAEQAVKFATDSSPELPEGWTLAKLPEIASIKMGQSPPGNTYNDQQEGLPFYQGKKDFGDLNPTVRQWCTAPIKIADPGDILLCIRAPVGPTNIADQRCAIGRGLAAIKPSGEIPSKWLLYSFRFKEASIAEQGTGSTFTAISQRHLDNIEIEVPPLPEQRRIIAQVDTLEESLKPTKERLARVPGILKQFRQSVLAAACSGRLTADWRIDKTALEPALTEIDYNQNDLPEIPDEWRWSTVAMLSSKSPRSIQSGPFGSNLRHSEFQDSGILVLGIDNVLDGQFSMGRQHRISHEKFKELEKFSARPLDVLITVMATVGRCCVLPDNIEPAIITKHVYRITVNRKYVEPFYLMLALRSNQIQNQISQHIRGQTRPGINGQILKSTSIPLPPLAEQDEIVRRVEALFRLADAIEARVAAGAHRAEKLTQAILAKAFRGELVPTEAELARREGRDYEPAAVLLARLQEERRLTAEAQPRRQTLKGRKRKKACT